MSNIAAVLETPVKADLEPGEPAHARRLAPKARAFRGTTDTSVDLLLIYSPTARPLPSRNGVRRWEYRGRIYREIPLEALYAGDDENQSTRGFRKMDSLMRAKPHRSRAA